MKIETKTEKKTQKNSQQVEESVVKGLNDKALHYQWKVWP